MSELTWKYVKPLKNPKAVEVFLDKHRVNLPNSLVKCLTNNNGGRPSVKVFDTDQRKEYVFKSLLSYNEDDLETIYKVYPALFEGMDLYPIGSDAGGNFVCYDISEGRYVLLNHETNAREIILVTE